MNIGGIKCVMQNSEDSFKCHYRFENESVHDILVLSTLASSEGTYNLLT